MDRQLIAAGVLVALTGAASGAEDAGSYRERLLADASMRQIGLTGAGAGGFTITDGPGDYSLTVEGQVLTRYHLNVRETPPPADDNSTTSGFEIRQAKLWFSGNIVSTDLGYHIEVMHDYDGGTLVLGDAVMWWAIDNESDITVGQFKTPFMRESMVDSRHQLAHERSVVELAHGLERTQGVAYSYAGDDWRFTASYNSGGNVANTAFSDPVKTGSSFTGRLEWKPMGQWEVFRDLTSFRDSETSLLFGAAAHYQDAGDPRGLGVDVDVTALTGDVSVEGDGWNAFGSVVWTKVSSAAVGSPIDFFGLVAQGGLFISDSDELFVRYDVVIDQDALNHEFMAGTLGWNHYFVPASHALKLTVGVQVFDDVGAQTLFMPSASVGLLADDDSPQFDLFGQMQILF